MITQYEFKLIQQKRGFHLITNEIINNISELPKKGLLNLFIKHTSAGLTLNENADPTVRIDFETIFNRLIPEGLDEYKHDYEGDDDLPAHIKSSIIGPSITIPISNNKLSLGTWQGVYLCEFRNNGGKRKIIATIYH